ncbi:putative histone-lysine N-methyltransferase, H3 lysine-4 specific [Cryptosporidium felis]|nr:putative histone-lysine N-methyltransferase, H3 lysine-4 specific [Cryptosporidium felis]
MRNINSFEIYHRLNINYSNKQVISSPSINLKKEQINQDFFQNRSQLTENNVLKHHENENMYIDSNFNPTSISLQPCIATKEKSLNLPTFELTYEFQIPHSTYKVKQNSRLYEEIYSIIYSKYSKSGNDFEDCLLRKYKLSESTKVFDIPEKDQPYSLFWDSENIYSNSALLLGELTGMLYKKKENFNNKYLFDLPNKSNFELDCTLDASYHRNEFSFLKHCKLPFPFDDKCLKPNTQLQWLFINHWPHLVVMTIPGVEIKKGDELIIDFGENYHRIYVNDFKDAFKKMIGINTDNLQNISVCNVCKFNLGETQDYKKCSICQGFVHIKCGYFDFTSENSIYCLTCIKNSLSSIFGTCKNGNYIVKEKNKCNLYREVNNIVKMLDSDPCEECNAIFYKKKGLDKRKSGFLCKLIHELCHLDKHSDSIDSFYAEYGTKDDSDSISNISLDIKVINNIYNIFEKLTSSIKGTWERNSVSENLKIEIELFQDQFVSFANSPSKNLFPEPLIYEKWVNSKWRNLIYWNKIKNCWTGVLKPNGIQCNFSCSTKYPTLIEAFYEAEKWVEQRISETAIPNELVPVVFSNAEMLLAKDLTGQAKKSEENILHANYHSPYLPTDLASHPDYKIINNEEACKYPNTLIETNDCGNSFPVNDQITAKIKENQMISDRVIHNYSYQSSSELVMSDLRSRITPTGYIQCCSPINRKRRIRSTLPLTSNAAKCPTEWRVRGITWHAERKAFIVPYRRDKDGGLTSTTFGAMKYGSPLTAFLKALEFRENYLKEQSTKLPEEMKQPNVICDQALLIRNLPNIIWDPNKLVWRALTGEELLCDDTLTRKLNINSQDIEVNAIPYGARIAYEIAEVCYIRRKALLLNSKDGNLIQKGSLSGNRIKCKSNSIDQLGIEYPLALETQNCLFLSKDSQIEVNSQGPYCKYIRLKMIFPNGEEVVRDDLIAWHFRTNSWIISNLIDENANNQTKNYGSANYLDSSKQKTVIQSLVCAIECCSAIPSKCQVYIHAEEAESIIDSEDLAELLKPFPTGISWYCKKRRFYTSNGLDSNGRGQHFSIALYGSLVAAFNAAIEYRNIFLKNRRKIVLPRVEWILCYPTTANTIKAQINERLKDSKLAGTGVNIEKNAHSCPVYDLPSNYLENNTRNIDRIDGQIVSISACISNNSYNSGEDWLQHPTTVSLLDDQLIETQNEIDNRILNIDLIN